MEEKKLLHSDNKCRSMHMLIKRAKSRLELEPPIHKNGCSSLSYLAA